MGECDSRFNMRIVIVLLSAFLIQGCNTTKNPNEYDRYIKSVDSEVVTYYKDGTVKTKMPLKKGFKDGVAYSYHPNGTKRSEITYKDDKLNGIQKLWYNNGVLKSEESIKNNIKHGFSKYFHKEGWLLREFFSDNGETVWFVLYNKDGSVDYKSKKKSE